MVVDHDAHMRAIVRLALESAGFVVLKAQEGRAALEAMTVGLLEIEVLELSKRLRECANGDIPIIALSAHAMQGDEAQALTAGCDAYVAKPIDTRTFATFVTQFLPRPAEAVE